MDLADELLVALRMRDALVEPLHVLERLDQRRLVLAAAVAALLDRRLDHEQRLPAAEHVRVGGDVLGIALARAVGVDADLVAVERGGRGRQAVGVARHGLPEISAFEVVEAGAGDVHGFERVDEAEQLGPVVAEELAHLLDEGQHARADHDVVDDLGAGRNLGEVLGVRRFGRRDRQQGGDLAAQAAGRRSEEVAVIVAEGIVGEDHGDLLAQIVGHPGRYRADLLAHVGDAGLEHVAVQHARGHVIALADHEVRHLQFARARRRADHHVGEQGAEHEIDLVLGGEFLDHLGATLGIGAVVLDHHLDRPPADAAGLVDVVDRGPGGALVPAPVGRPDAGSMNLEADPDRRVAAGMGARRKPGQRGRRGHAGQRAGAFHGGPPRHAGRGTRGLAPVVIVVRLARHRCLP